MFRLKKTLSALSLLTALVLFFTVIVPGFAGGGETAPASSYTITNPYASVKWDEFTPYKAALHTHTNASDGDITLMQSLERHSECGFDLVATTDHGTVNYSWSEPNPNKLIYGALSLVGKSEGELKYLGNEGNFDNGSSYTISTENGDDYLKVSSGKTIMRIPNGIENNALSANAHVNGFFADYHNNTLTTYADAIKGVDKNGGISVINHPGEYSKSRYELHSADAYNTDKFTYRYLVNKWARLLDKYDSCIGIDINSKGDGRTRFDRVLWDVLLERFADNGDTVYAICSSDAHQLNKIDTGFTYILMPSLTSANTKSALKNGEFIGGSHCNGNYDELVSIAEGVKTFYGETAVYSALMKTANAMADRVKKIENGEMDADEDVGICYDLVDGEGYFNGDSEPMVTSISVDDDADTITISTTDALIVRWISNGKVIATTKADESTLKLSDYSGKLGNYVRAEVFGEGGFLYIQPFILNAQQNAGKSPVVDSGFIDLGILDCLLPIFNNWGEILGRIFANI